MGKKMTLIFGGDTSFGPNGEKYFGNLKELLGNADVRMAQLETPFCKEASEFCKPEHTTAVLDPLIGRFDLMTLCGNHFYDQGEIGVKDTIDWLDEHGIIHAGGGSNLKEASAPAFFEKDGVKFGVLGFNAVGPKSSFASETKGGDAFVNFTRVMIPVEEDTSRHENDVYDFKKPIHFEGEVNRTNFVDPQSLMDMADAIAAIRDKCDILIVYYHKGWVHAPAAVPPHERLMCRIAIDAGADLVIGTHSHLLRGMEIYKGKPIYHGLNNFVMWVPGLSPNYKGERSKDTKFSNGEEWVKNRIARFGFVPDPEYPTYPFHPDSIYTAAAKLIIEDGKIADQYYVPLLVNKEGVTNVVSREDGGQAVFDYIEKITEQAGLRTRYEWAGEDVHIIAE